MQGNTRDSFKILQKILKDAISVIARKMRSVILKKSKKVLAFFDAIQNRISFLKAIKQNRSSALDCFEKHRKDLSSF
ncbi:MAG: hypothetical protein A3I12_05875 [Gammaproteobacteria bacterium RIFCSPLOWO2_02_FULL_38_11]|nr:MAG: hypothetical protein A3B69_02350 [Gammaproteobacteria bacterium RIFCSPHIGHO2_02_FULL_38_33]OGT24478.1 MAG: hypothetical protein A2W47_03500 [Gammaproteobacteria bacterium RIFCSPHIGHO2_12_38_15]OGT69078.1 MAG: hypothetical protein A3I12_05875 [Gammaproteobacteria bacterium RIFCSPLOWO2_02_FULL_38_11]OGT77652.1 MAG: hypothetical protein A3G71_02035 [Gammaproteobacteria bacterium RIFCSPLOWO2_12_FULL_38_14]